MKTEITIRGDARRLHLEPGDKLVVTLHDRVSREAIATMQKQLQAVFPTTEVLIVARGELGVIRASSDSPVPLRSQ